MPDSPSFPPRAALTVLGNCLLLAVGVLLAACGGADASDSDATGVPAATSSADGSSAGVPSASAVCQQAERLIGCLDAADFTARNEAADELAALGPSVIPQLVEALGRGSRELRFRARVILTLHYSFEEVAPHLLVATNKEYGPAAAAVLRERAYEQVEIACQVPNIDRLVRFWGTDAETFRDRALRRVAEAKTQTELDGAVGPLLGICERTVRFGDAIARLESLGLPHDHQHSPGFVIASTLARGLGENRADWTSFAERHLQALETLAAGLRQSGTPASGVRKEVSDRANMSQGAAAYLVQALDAASQPAVMMTEELNIQPDWLREEFCRGLAALDPAECDRCVGKVHIVDMLTEQLLQWPARPRDGVVARLVAEIQRTAVEGNKPKALGFLDALDACGQLAAHRLNVEADLGRQLAERLYAASGEASNNRAYHPARSVHDKIVKLIDLGIAPDHAAFPRAYCDDYLRKAEQATSEEQRFALGRYVAVLERLREAGLSLEQPGARQFTLALRDGLVTRRELLASGIAELDRLLRDRRTTDGRPDRQAIDEQLAAWTNRVLIAQLSRPGS